MSILLRVNWTRLMAEAALSVLLSTFTFAPSGKKVRWNLSNVRFPTVGGDPKPTMPMKVALYHPATNSS